MRGRRSSGAGRKTSGSGARPKTRSWSSEGCGPSTGGAGRGQGRTCAGLLPGLWTGPHRCPRGSSLGPADRGACAAVLGGIRLVAGKWSRWGRAWGRTGA